jgi:uncharacterized membrane protein YphA (DoxX/SURF4 family)
VPEATCDSTSSRSPPACWSASSTLLVVAGRPVWLGAVGLGVLTAVAMLVANDFWSMTGQDRFMALNTFFEHLGLIAGFVLVSIRAEEAGP